MKLKVVHIIPSLEKGGAERLVIDIVRHLSFNKDINVCLVIFKDLIEYEIDDIRHLLKIIPSFVKLSFLKTTNKIENNNLQAFFNEFSPDIIHSHLFEAELISRFCLYPKAKWFSHAHDNIVQLRRLSFKSLFFKSTYTNYFEKKVLFKRFFANGGTHFLTISNDIDNYIKSVQSSFPVTLVSNGVTLKRFKKSVNSKGLKKLSLNDKIKIVNVGSFQKKKNQNLVLDIINEINKTFKKVEVIFLGEGPEKINVINKAKKLKIFNQTKFLGNVENVENHLWNSNIYVHTSLYEPFGLAIVEAIAAGLPVVCLNTGGVSDIVKNNLNGYLINSKNPKIFAKKIIQFYNNNDLRKNLEKSVLQFDISTYVNNLLRVYSS